VNGCFWHGHEGCKKFRMPKTRVEFWTGKIERNRQRDGEAIEKLQRLGWDVVVILGVSVDGEEAEGDVEWVVGCALWKFVGGGSDSVVF